MGIIIRNMNATTGLSHLRIKPTTMKFEHPSQFVNIPFGSVLDFGKDYVNAENHQVTFHISFKMNSITGSGYEVLAKAGGESRGWVLYLDNGEFCASVNNGSSDRTINTNFYPVIDKWYNFYVMFNGTTGSMRVYENNSIIRRYDDFSPFEDFNGVHNFTIGGTRLNVPIGSGITSTGYDFFTDMQLHRFRFWSRELLESEIPLANQEQVTDSMVIDLKTENADPENDIWNNAVQGERDAIVRREPISIINY